MAQLEIDRSAWRTRGFMGGRLPVVSRGRAGGFAIDSVFIGV